VNKIRKALENEEWTQVNIINYRKDGHEFMNNFALMPLRNKGGKLSYFIGIQGGSDSLFAFVKAVNKFQARN